MVTGVIVAIGLVAAMLPERERRRYDEEIEILLGRVKQSDLSFRLYESVAAGMKDALYRVRDTMRSKSVMPPPFETEEQATTLDQTRTKDHKPRKARRVVKTVAKHATGHAVVDYIVDNLADWIP